MHISGFFNLFLITIVLFYTVFAQQDTINDSPAAPPAQQQRNNVLGNIDVSFTTSLRDIL
jgi:hypothetical protein